MRIIAGAFRGRKLLSPPGRSNVRPITGMAKKSLFDMLAGCVDGATVLDLYCGTGTLGIEAISRGAAKCCFADRGRDLLSRLLRNIQAVGAADRCVIWRGDVGTNLAGWLGELDGQVDLAFVDPPYPLTQAWDWAKAADMIFRPLARRLTAEGLVVLRTSVRLELPELLGGLAIQRARRYGGMAVTMYGHQGQAARPEEAR